MCKGIFIWKLKKECLSQSISKSKFSNIISVDALFLDLKAMKIVFTTFLCHMNISVAKIAIKRNPSKSNNSCGSNISKWIKVICIMYWIAFVLHERDVWKSIHHRNYYD